jgi:hypothetical protein
MGAALRVRLPNDDSAEDGRKILDGSMTLAAIWAGREASADLLGQHDDESSTR